MKYNVEITVPKVYFDTARDALKAAYAFLQIERDPSLYAAEQHQLDRTGEIVLVSGTVRAVIKVSK